MSLSPSVARRPLHTRTIVCEGFQREDGRYDIEGRLYDTKAYRFVEPFRGLKDAGSPVHDMAVRMVVDGKLVLHDIEVEMPVTPYPTCGAAAPNFRALIGVSVSAGWRREVQERVGTIRGCTHVRELLFSMATTAFQTIAGWPAADPDGPRFVLPHPKPGKRPPIIDSCVAWAADGEVVARRRPEWAVPKRTE